MISVDQDYTREVICEYKGEHYKVRDNGAIFRMAREGKPKRPKDEIWTFGDKIVKGYAIFCGESVHRIVAFAFIGEPPTKQHVVDHIDTNRQNNRPENLRWLTKLENILINSYTKAKIVYLCGSVENFLSNPSLLAGHENEDSNFSWMRAVTREEAENTLRNWEKLINSPKGNKKRSTNQIEEWIFHNIGNSRFTNNPIFEERDFEEQESNVFENKEPHIERKTTRNSTNEELIEQPITKKEFMHAMQSTFEDKGLNYIKYYKTDTWQSDFLVTIAGKQYAFSVYRTNKAAADAFSIMKNDGVVGYGLKLSPKKNITDDIPCFGLHRLNDEMLIRIDKKTLSLTHFLDGVLSGKLSYNPTTLITELDVLFTEIKCYLCGEPHHIYSVNRIVDEHGNRINPNAYFEFEEELIPDLTFGIEIQSIVKKYIDEHPEMNIKMGAIKKRFSKTRDEDYMSFGCPKCDGIVGDYYLQEIQMEAIYEEDPKKIHRIKLETPFELPLGHWEIEE